MKDPRVVLVSMPWASVTEPSLGLSILDGVLAFHGVESRVRHFGVQLLRYLGPDTYRLVADVYAANDFVFSGVLEGETSATQRRALSEICAELWNSISGWRTKCATPSDILALFETIREDVAPSYIDDCCEQVLAAEPTMVGFSCLYDQTVASLALASRLKAHRSDLLTVFGGYALHGAVGQQVEQSFSFVDRVFQGPAEESIVALSWESVTRGAPSRASSDSTELGQRPAAANFPNYPPPRFDGYFQEISLLETRDHIRITAECLPIEASRGCWWGQLHHCTFCGIDDATMRYSSRPHEDVLRELRSQRDRYGIRTFRFVDYILPYRYYDNLLPLLAGEGLSLRCEIKANVRHDDVALLARAGFVEVQPGIESFSTEILHLMNKGTTGIQNAQCLKLGRLFGIRILHNLLYGFPGESAEAYEAMIKQIPLLYHLDPPENCMEVLTTRFAPLRESPDTFNIERRGHDHRYEVVFSEEYREQRQFDLERYCYYFERGYAIPSALAEFHRMVDVQVDHWKAAHASGNVQLNWALTGDGIAFFDTRLDPRGEWHRFGPIHAELYMSCDRGVCSKGSMLNGHPQHERSKHERALQDLVTARVVYVEGNRLLGLAIGSPPARSVRSLVTSADDEGVGRKT